MNNNSFKEDQILGHAFLYLSAKYLNKDELFEKFVESNLDKALYDKFKTENLQEIVTQAVLETQKQSLIVEQKPVVKEQKKPEKPAASEVNFASFF